MKDDAFRFTAFDLILSDFDKTLLFDAGSIWGLFWVVNGYYGQSCITLPMISFMISVVPPPMLRIRESR
jgi:hypothetical protein